MRFAWKLLAAIDALVSEWDDSARWPCRYKGHRLNVIDSDEIRCSRCAAYAPSCHIRLREIEIYGFAFD